ncbi:MAG TPA: hypothetical protein VHO92_03160 [Methanobacterium sp.]|nr:hypothetical protein [Methanobacterium sp.]
MFKMVQKEDKKGRKTVLLISKDPLKIPEHNEDEKDKSSSLRNDMKGEGLHRFKDTEKLKEDNEFARKTELALDKIEKGHGTRMKGKDFLKELDTW